MRAIYAKSVNAEDPLSALVVGHQEEDVIRDKTPPEWVRVKVAMAAINHHDLWALRGAALQRDRTPMVLGTDAAGIDEGGREVIVHSAVSPGCWAGDPALDPGTSLLSEIYPGTLAEYVWVPSRNLVPKPAELSWEQAACLPTSWLTAYRMACILNPAPPGATVLVRGISGGVATALIALAAASGYRVWATTRDIHDRSRVDRAIGLGAGAVFASEEKLPDFVDTVFEMVGQNTWGHTLESLKIGGSVIICGATSGSNAPTDLKQVYRRHLRIIGTTMGTAHELAQLANFLVTANVRPTVDTVLEWADAAEGFRRLNNGEQYGKIVIKP